MDLKSNELINAAETSADSLTPERAVVTLEQLRSTIAAYLGQKDYSLLKNFDQSIVMSIASVSSEELLQGMVSCIRTYMLTQIRSKETNYTDRVIIVDKIFDALKSLIDVISTHNIKTNKHELAATLLGNILKQIT